MAFNLASGIGATRRDELIVVNVTMITVGSLIVLPAAHLGFVLDSHGACGPRVCRRPAECSRAGRTCSPTASRRTIGINKRAQAELVLLFFHVRRRRRRCSPRRVSVQPKRKKEKQMMIKQILHNSRSVFVPTKQIVIKLETLATFWSCFTLLSWSFCLPRS